MSAIISPCETYRYELRRGVSYVSRVCVFIMLNPSTADAENDDPTIRRCISYAKDWGCGELIVVNLFAYRATNPKELYKADDPVGPENMHHVKHAAALAHAPFGPDQGMVVCAWGAHGGFMGQDETVLGWLQDVGVPPMALALTKGGQPRHPLYLPKHLRPQLYER